MKAKNIQATLATIEAGEYYNIFNLLPSISGGEHWIGEIKDCARSMSEWLDPEREYDLDDLRDLGGQWANSECEDYYSNINKRVQDLSLWASTELDFEVAELGGQMLDGTLTGLNSLYLYAAMRQLFDAVADQAFIHSTELQDA